MKSRRVTSYCQLALVVLVVPLSAVNKGCSCDSSSPPPAATGAVGVKGGRPTWTMDLEQMHFADAPVAGQVQGQSFRPDKVTLNNNVLTFRQGKDVFADAGVEIFLFPKGDSLEGQSFTVGAKNGFNQPYVHLTHREGNLPKTEMFMDRYAMKLEFGKADKGSLPGKIYLCVNDGGNSFIAGSFVAEGSGADPIKKKLSPGDAPYAQGKIAFKGQVKGMVTVGYVGEDASGKAQSNQAGLIYQEGMQASVTSTTFAPRVSSLVLEKAGGASFRHVKLAPGRYLFFVSADKRCLDWRWLDVKADDQATLDLTADATNTGSLQIAVPPELAKEKVYLVPLDEAGKLPELKVPVESLAWSIGMLVPVAEDKATLDGVRPGSYRAVAGKATVDVQVRAGEQAKAELKK